MKCAFQVEEVECKIALYIRVDCIVCKCLFGLFGAFAVKVRNWWVGRF